MRRAVRLVLGAAVLLAVVAVAPVASAGPNDCVVGGPGLCATDLVCWEGDGWNDCMEVNHWYTCLLPEIVGLCVKEPA